MNLFPYTFKSEKFILLHDSYLNVGEELINLEYS